MFNLSSNSYPIGIDAGAHALRLLQFKKGGGGPAGMRLQAACRIELDSLQVPEAQQFSAGLRHALGSQSFAGRRVAISLPSTVVQSKSIRLPQMPDSDLTQALQWESKDRFGFEIGDSAGQLAWFRAGEVRRGTEIKDELLLFAVPGEVINTYVTTLTGLGLQLSAIDLGPCAAYRSLYRANPAIAAGTGAILDIGHRGTQFMITRDGELVFYKHVEVGGKVINETIAAKLGISPVEATQMRARLSVGAGMGAGEDNAPLEQALKDAMRAPLEELSRELDMCMRYYVVTFRGARPEAVNVIGREAASVQIRESLASSLGLSFEEAQPLRGVQDLGDAARPDRSGEWAVAAGLSLHTHDAATPAEAA